MSLSTADLRASAIAEFRRLGATVERVKDDQFSLVAQVYRISRDGVSKTVALRTSFTGWFGAICASETDPTAYNTMSEVDAVALVYAASPARAQFVIVPSAMALAGFEVHRNTAVSKGRTFRTGDQVWAPLESLTRLGDSAGKLDLMQALMGFRSLMHGFALDWTPVDAVAALTEDDGVDVDPIQAALGLPDWMWAAVLDRSNRIGVAPDVVIRVLLGDHLAAGTQAPLPVSLGA